MQPTSVRSRTAFETVYSGVVAIKGFDGAVELVLGALLLAAPASLSGLLGTVSTELAEGGPALRLAAAGWIGQAGVSISGGAVPVALFLAVHGVVKLLTVYCLLRRLVRWYPVAIGVLTLLLVAQTVDLVVAPGIGAAVLAVLDLVVVALVVWEYRRLRAEVASANAAH